MRKTWLLVGVLILLTGALLAFSLTSKKGQAPKETQKAVVTIENEKPQTHLSFSDETKSASGSSLFQIDVLINSGTNKITGAQVELSYDPKVLSRVDISSGSFIKVSVEVIKKIDNKTGTVSFVLGSKLNESAQGEGILAHLTYLRLNNSQTKIDFLPQTLITARGFSESVLVGTTPAILGLRPTIFQNNGSSSSTIR